MAFLGARRASAEVEPPKKKFADSMDSVDVAQLTPSTSEDFLFKGYAEANLEPTRGLQTIKQAFDPLDIMNPGKIVALS